MTVSADGVEISASHRTGLFYGLQSLAQLLPLHADAAQLPCLHVRDQPRFAWRGVLLDSARHFFTKQEVCTLLDTLARYKLNRLHWHLVDDQGWRLEIGKYPELADRAELFAGRRPGDRRVRRRARHHGRAGDRDARPFGGDPGSHAGTAVRPGGRQLRQRLLRGQRPDVRRDRGHPRRDLRAVPVGVRPHRRRRGRQAALEAVSQVPVADAARRARERRRSAELLHRAGRGHRPQARPAAARLGRDHGRGAGALRSGDVLAEPGRRRGLERPDPGGRGTGPPDRDDPADLLLPRLPPGRELVQRTERLHRHGHAAHRLWPGADSSGTGRGAPGQHPRRAGQPVVRPERELRLGRLPALPPRARAGRGRLVTAVDPRLSIADRADPAPSSRGLPRCG